MSLKTHGRFQVADGGFDTASIAVRLLNAHTWSLKNVVTDDVKCRPNTILLAEVVVAW